MTLSPDDIAMLRWHGLALNATILFTWAIMALLTLLSAWATRRISDGDTPSRWQTLMEVLVTGLRDQIREVSQADPGPYLPFIGTLFLFIATSNLLAIVPGFEPPTASLSTTTALAACVFVAVPVYGIAQQGLRAYARRYLQPSAFMLPFNILGEVSRTIALAVRLYGNIMSATLIVAILIGIAPFFFPVLMELLGLITGLIQAYIFAVLAMVYIASARQSQR